MRTRKKAAEAGGSAAGPKAGVRKKKGKGAVVQKRVVLRGKSSSKSEAQGPGPSARPGQQQQPEQQQQQRQQDGGAAAGQPEQQPQPVKRRRSLAPAGDRGGGDGAPAAITSLTSEALQEVFLQLAKQEQEGYCREVLPLVCKRFRDVLAEPSAVWESVHIDFIQKGLDLAFPELRQPEEGGGGDGSGGEPGGANRRLLHSAVERWLKPRAASVKRLVLSFSARDQTHSFPRTGHGLRRLFHLLAPTLQELCIAHCSDIFHAKSFADLAQLQSLERLAVTFMSGRVPAADLAALEGLHRLRALTLTASRTAEEAGDVCLAGFPDPLLKLKGLTSLSISSMGVTTLPANITRLKHLECLDASGCPLAFVPSQLWKLAALRHLRLNGTCLMVGLLHTWEPLAKLPALESLELRDTKASALPPTLTGLAALTSLDLSDNAFDQMAGLEDGLAALSGLPGLRRLLLRCCQLPSVPAEVCSLSGLTHLDLSRNQLVELPPALSSLMALRELVVEGCNFPRVPQASSHMSQQRVLAKLPALEVADLSFNIYMEAAVSLQPLVADGGLANLKRLDLRKLLGVWKDSSIKWLRGLAAALEERHAAAGGSPGSRPVLLWD